jgi:hypothetical protein
MRGRGISQECSPWEWGILKKMTHPKGLGEEGIISVIAAINILTPL